MVDLFFYKELDKAIDADEDDGKGDDDGKPAPTKEKGAWDQQGEDVEEGGDWDQ